MSFVRTLPLAVLLSLALLVLLVAPPGAVAQQKAFTATEAAQHVGEDVAITGKVVAVSKSAKGTTFMNFGDKFPRNIFSGTVLARDEAKVGDVKMYEGKVVTITGRIELDQGQKPQILINSPTQIRVSDEAGIPAPPPATTAAVPAPPAAPRAPMPSTVPALPTPTVKPPLTASLPPATPLPKPVELKKISLASTWNSPGQGGELTRKDLASLFGDQGTSSDSTEGDPSVLLFGDVPFLSPLSLAKKRLHLEGVSDSVSKVTTPGLPASSFSAHGFTGIFAGGFNRLNIVTDLADQVVSMQLVDDNPRQRSSDITDTNGYHTYNFVNGRSKGTNELVVKHQVVKDGALRGVVVVDSVLLDPNELEPGAKPAKPKSSSSSSGSSSRTPKTAKVNERARWYVPGPLVNLILRCVGNR